MSEHHVPPRVKPPGHTFRGVALQTRHTQDAHLDTLKVPYFVTSSLMSWMTVLSIEWMVGRSGRRYRLMLFESVLVGMWRHSHMRKMKKKVAAAALTCWVLCFETHTLGRHGEEEHTMLTQQVALSGHLFGVLHPNDFHRQVSQGQAM